MSLLQISSTEKIGFLTKDSYLLSKQANYASETEACVSSQTGNTLLFHASTVIVCNVHRPGALCGVNGLVSMLHCGLHTALCIPGHNLVSKPNSNPQCIVNDALYVHCSKVSFPRVPSGLRNA